MAEGLFHPPHVAASLVEIEEFRADELRATLLVRDPRVPGYLWDEVLVRLIRRSRVEDDQETEGLVFEALIERVSTWAWRKFSLLLPLDREQMAIMLGEVVFERIARDNRVDFWEITFNRSMNRAASDIYQKHFADKIGKIHDEFDLKKHEVDDEGDFSNKALEESILQARAAKILDSEEMPFFYPLFLSGVPLSSPRASTDLVRMLGKPEGTLREIKTRIKAKLKAAWKEQA